MRRREPFEPLPTDRWERAKLIKEDSTDFIRRLSKKDINKLLWSLGRTHGLTVDELPDDERFNVDASYVPDYLKD